MATSGITSYQLTRDQIIDAAIGALGVLAEGQTPSTQDRTDAAVFLNTAVAEFRAKQVPLWSRKEYTFTPTNNVATYTIGTGQTLNTVFPVKLLQAYIVETNSNSRTPMDIIADYNYNMLPTGPSTGRPIQLTYQPKINFGILKLWPTPDTSPCTITLVYQSPFEYFTTGTDTMDFPEEYYNALIYKLATLLAPKWQLPLEDRKMLRDEAKEYFENVYSLGGEDSSFYIYPENRDWK